MLSFAGAEEYLKEQCQEIVDRKKNYDQANSRKTCVCGHRVGVVLVSAK